MATQDDCIHTSHQVDAQHVITELEAIQRQLELLREIERGLRVLLSAVVEYRKTMQREALCKE